MKASPVTRIVGMLGLLGLAPIAAALGMGHRSLPEAALAAAVWFAAVILLSWTVRTALCSAMRRAEHRARQRQPTDDAATVAERPSG